MEKPKDLKDVEPDSGQRPPACGTARPGRSRRTAETGRSGAAAVKRPKEIGGPSGPEPTRYGDWEKKGIISDF